MVEVAREDVLRKFVLINNTLQHVQSCRDRKSECPGDAFQPALKRGHHDLKPDAGHLLPTLCQEVITQDPQYKIVRRVHPQSEVIYEEWVPLVPTP